MTVPPIVQTVTQEYTVPTTYALAPKVGTI
jgi:hypothetical protein